MTLFLSIVIALVVLTYGSRVVLGAFYFVRGVVRLFFIFSSED